MEREILFKAKRVDNSKWVEGSLQLPNTDREETRIVSWNAVRYEVNPETVCQFTGLLDKNGNKIFEGDYDSRKRVVMWNENLNLHCLHNENLGTYIVCYYPFSKRDALEIEIIGNIHD